MSKRPLYIPYAGPALLEAPLLNKGSAFTEYERLHFNLIGLVPHAIESIEEQADRAYQQFSSFDSDLDKHIYLRNIQDINETLFYRLVTDHTEEIMPIIYTPTVGAACQEFSHIYRSARGIFIPYPDRDNIDDMLQNATKQNVKVVVVTDGERILGLGDQGIGGMGIPIGKLSLYVACGGISPAHTLPIVLDVGCNNQELIDDPLYMGWKHERITGDEYDAFIAQFMEAVQRRWPNVLIQFEDFAQHNANRLLEEYQDKACCFNDDIQGTASVTVGTLLAAARRKGEQLKDQSIVFLGAGSAGCGIGEQIVAQMQVEGLSEKEARQRVFIVGRKGLLHTQSDNLKSHQMNLVQPYDEIESWLDDSGNVSLINLIEAAKPTVLVGVSGQPGVFTEEIIKTLHKHCETPLVLPLSNPTSKIEALPEDILKWTNGEAVVATGSPFTPIEYNGKTHVIAQCNNSYIFPGVGLAVIASKARRVTNKMLMVASEALADTSPSIADPEAPLLPPLSESRDVSRKIALRVYQQAIEDGVAESVSESVMAANIDKEFWEPAYREYRRVSF